MLFTLRIFFWFCRVQTSHVWIGCHMVNSTADNIGKTLFNFLFLVVQNKIKNQLILCKAQQLDIEMLLELVNQCSSHNNIIRRRYRLNAIGF